MKPKWEEKQFNKLKGFKEKFLADPGFFECSLFFFEIESCFFLKKKRLEIKKHSMKERNFIGVHQQQEPLLKQGSQNI